MPHRLLVVANETVASPRVVEEVRLRAHPDGQTLVISPQLHARRLHHWLSSDEEGVRTAARERLEATLAALRDRGVPATGRLGDPDPLMALDDAYREFAPDEIVVATHPPGRSQWLERQLVARARARYPVPVTHLVVDLARDTMEVDPDGRHAGAGGRDEEVVTLFHAAAYNEAMRIRHGGFRDVAEGGMVRMLAAAPPGDEDAVVFSVRVPARDLAGYAGAPEAMAVPAGLLDRHGPPVETDTSSVE